MDVVKHFEYASKPPIRRVINVSAKVAVVLFSKPPIRRVVERVINVLL